MKRIVLIIGALALLLSSAQTASAQDERQGRKYVRHGNRLFRADKYEDANVEYRKALEADSTNTVARYNLSRSMFPQDWLNVKALSKAACDTLRNGFLRAAEEESDAVRKSMSYYNTGVLFQRLGALGLAVDSYKEALRLNPADDEARYNLVVCKRQLKNQPQKQQQDGQDDQNSDQQKKDEEKQQQQKQEQKKEEQQQQQQQQQEQHQPPMSKENAEQLLNNAKREENQTQKRMQRMQQQPSNRKEKNW